MRELTRTILTVNILLVVLLAISGVLVLINNHYKEVFANALNAKAADDEIKISPSIAQGPLDSIIKILYFIIIVIFPIFLIIMGAKHYYTDSSLNYVKSLTIPALYLILEVILTIIYQSTCAGENCMGIIFILPHFAIFLVLILITNLVVYFFKSR